MKRRYRKKLKEDELVTTFNKVLNFVKKWKREFIVGGFALLFALLMFAAVQFVKSQSMKRQNVLLADIFQIRSEMENSPEKIVDLEKLAGRGAYSRMANLQLGTYWFEQGDFGRALEQLQKIPPKKKDLIHYQALDLTGQIYLEQGEYDEAIQIYTKIEEENPKNYSLDGVLFRKALALEKKGDTNQALLVYKQIQEDYPQTYIGMDASQKVLKLEEKK